MGLNGLDCMRLGADWKRAERTVRPSHRRTRRRTVRAHTHAHRPPARTAPLTRPPCFSHRSVNSPACDYYQCHVTWARGQTVAVNWIGPTKGDVSIQLVSNIGGKTYDIVDSIPAFSQTGYCDAGYGLGVAVPRTPCGMVSFVVPQGWAINVNCEQVLSSSL